MINRRQINQLVFERNRRVSIMMSAMKAGVSRNTARKYLRQADPSKQENQPHDWRTRKDPLEAIWSAARGMLETAPELQAKALLEHLSERMEGGIEENVLRTFQRRVRQWRLKHGKEKEVFFSQEARPAAVLAVDWTDMRDLGVSVCGVKLEHLMFHAVLPYSSWQWAVRCRSESLLSVRSGLKATIGRLGRVPRELLIDNSSTATHRLSGDGKRRGFNDEFVSICEHYGLSPRTTNVSCPHENGTCESMHGHFKRRLEQHLLLRGSRDFASEEEYDGFVIGVLERANGLRGERFAQEVAVMREHLAAELPDYTETMVRVNSNSTIRVCKRVYSVPSKLIGSRLRARIHETHIVLLDGMVVLAELPLRGGDRGAVIDFRHVIKWLVRKPGAFAEYRWREAMFPSLIWRAAYDHLCRHHDAHEADVCYLEILQLAANEGLGTVENLVEQLLLAPKAVVSAAEVTALLRTYEDEALAFRQREAMPVSLEVYDGLLGGDGL
jgi:transposase